MQWNDEQVAIMISDDEHAWGKHGSWVHKWTPIVNTYAGRIPVYQGK